MHEILREEYKELVYNKTPYGEEPSFSITINHKDTYTGVTDKDRALTIRNMSNICRLAKDGYNARDKFFNEFKAPGHVHLLIARKGLLNERNGHTELSIALADMAGITPAVAMCEMLDEQTHEALSIEKAREYGAKHNIMLISADEVREYLRLNVYER
jgi:3,4-dihydroxy 2-butanone 4-phosphate synthase